MLDVTVTFRRTRSMERFELDDEIRKSNTLNVHFSISLNFKGLESNSRDCTLYPTAKFYRWNWTFALPNENTRS